MTDQTQPPQDENKLIAERRAKLEKLRAAGIAFPNDFRRDALADIDLEEGRFQDAASHDDVLLRGDAEHAWAWPSWLYCRARLGDESAAEALGELARDASSSERARELGKRWTDAARR